MEAPLGRTTSTIVQACQLPEAYPKFTADDKGKITKLELVIAANGGLGGLLAQICAEHALARVAH